MDQGLDIHAENDFHLVRENQLLNHSVAEGRVLHAVAHDKAFVRSVVPHRAVAGVQLFHPFHFHRNGFFHLRFTRGASDSAGRTGGRRCPRFFHAFFRLVVVLAFAGSTNHPGRNSADHGHDRMTQIHFAASTVTDEFFSNSERGRSVHNCGFSIP